MSIESASNFLVGSILLSVGILVFVAAAVAINNLLFRFWKPVKILKVSSKNMVKLESDTLTYFIACEKESKYTKGE